MASWKLHKLNFLIITKHMMQNSSVLYNKLLTNNLKKCQSDKDYYVS